MKILYVSDYFYPHLGGVEKLFEQLSVSLVQQKHEVNYITWRYDKKLPASEVFKGINIIRVNAPGRIFFPFFALPKIVRLAKHSSLIHTSTYSSAIGAWIAAKIAGRKTVLTVHEVWNKQWLDLPFLSLFEKWLFRTLERLMFKFSFSHYVAVSESTRNAMGAIGINPSKISRIYNGIVYNLPQWKRPDGIFNFVFFGRAGVSKGIDILIGAANRMVQLNNNVCFTFCVSKQDKRVLDWLSNELKNSRLREVCRLELNLPHGDLLSELMNAHCVVIPSFNEGFGFTAVEASAMGIPVISSGRGALSEVVSGRVIEMKAYHVDALVEAMQKAIRNEFGFIQPKTFPVQKFVDRHVELYKAVADGSNYL
ncbi:MAG TPA: glycosyltransferase family 4 protein [Prolixibacteraceae bacterium]|nr:glycosyltransferase family 4 protein [Prolixibacteraceae bacterium]